MLRPWLTDAGRQAIVDAVSYVEAHSAVEVVVAIRRRSRAWVHVPCLVGAVGAWATLAVMLFSAPAFALWTFLVDPIIVGALVGWAAGRSSAAIRWMTPISIRRRAVAGAANAAFVVRGVHGTRGRTGVLVYCALGEGVVRVVADTAVTRALTPDRLTAWGERIEMAIARGASRTAESIGAMAPVFAAALPRLHDDVNELPDAVDVGAEPEARP